MKATILQAHSNDRNLTILPSGYGHWKISCDYRGKQIHAITTNSVAIDNFNSDPFEKKDGRNRVKEGYQDLINEIIRKNT